MGKWADKEDVYQGDWIDYIRDCEKARPGYSKEERACFLTISTSSYGVVAEKVDAEENREKK